MNITSPVHQPKHNKNDRTMLASVIGSSLGIAGAVAGVYAIAKKGNPTLALKNLAFNEKDVLLIGTGSVLGGLAGGLVADKNKENVKPKLREASQQLVGNMLFPVGFLAAGNKLLEKSNFKLPKINSASRFANVANRFLGVLPKVFVTAASLVGGMKIGNGIMNSINNKIYNEEVKHNIHPEDFLVHTDDICFATSMLLKDVPKVSSVTTKILPATFLVSGIKTGIQEA